MVAEKRNFLPKRLVRLEKGFVTHREAAFNFSSTGLTYRNIDADLQSLTQRRKPTSTIIEPYLFFRHIVAAT